jgi:hypothetical protein
MANTKISLFPAVLNNDIRQMTSIAGAGNSASATNVNVRISGSSLLNSLEALLDLGDFQTGTLIVGRGGTGANTFTDHGILIGNATNPVSATAELANGQLLIGSTGNAPVPATLTQGTDISITNASGGITLNHATVSNTPATGSTTLNFGDTFNAIDSVTVSSQGHLTAQNTRTYTLPSAPTGATGANPSTAITGTVANGTASTFMRSDAVPALSNEITIGTAGTTRGIVSIEGGGSADAQLKLHCSAGSPQHAVTIEGPAHSGGNNYIVKLPTGLPAAGKVLEVDTYAANGGGTDYNNPPLATMKWADGSIYSTNGDLTGARSVTMGTHNLTFASTTAGQEVKFGQNVRIDGQSYTPLETISSTNSWTPDWDSGNVQTMELTAATTINNPSNIEVGATYIIILKQDGDGSHTVTWGNAYNFPANTPPILTTGANKADVITLVAYSSTVLMCTSVLDFATT